VVVEYIRYALSEAQAGAFEAAYEQARAALDASEHCLSYELSRGVEEPTNYILRIEWDSLEGHEQGFRRSAEFRPFFAAVRPFFDQIQEMRHYDATPVARARR
jgi:quinol monooxygenase YgiN